MNENILNDEHFCELMVKHCYEIMQTLIKTNTEFGIVVSTQFVKFEPKLPKDLSPKDPYSLYILAGYTFESIELFKDKITFHAGFGPNDFATFVSVDLGVIKQIQVSQEIIFVNFSNYEQKLEEQVLVEESKNMFLNSLKDKK